MKAKRVYQKKRRTGEQVERDRAVRARFQAEKPSLDSLVASGEFTAPIAQGEFLSLLELPGPSRQFEIVAA